MENMMMTYSIFSSIKTDNVVLNILISTVTVALVGCITKFLGKEITPMRVSNIVDTVKSLYYKKYVLKIDGTKTTASGGFSGETCISLVFSNRFKALWFHLIETMDENPSIHEVKELCNMVTSTVPKYDNNGNIRTPRTDMDLLVVSQTTPFLFNKEHDIYATVEFRNELNCDDDKKGKSSSKVEQIEISLYSYTTPIYKIKEYVNVLTEEYILALENERKTQKYIYTLFTTHYSNYIQECWSESLFSCSRTFDNMYFDGKAAVLKKIRFFLDNKEWYDANGIPYTLGLGLSGPPGTGKTSLLKALANLTGRHLVVIPLQLLKTRKQLREYWTETQYNTNNKKDAIPFSEKIILIEDIDCVGDIVLQRDTKKKKRVKEEVSELVDTDGKVSHGQMVLVKPKEEDPITLDDILNIIDGIEEAPGRILAITSNYYDKLDEALVRPGRIDITLNMKNASKQTIQDMFSHYYGGKIPPQVLKKIKPNVHSPAKIIGWYIVHRDDPEAFLQELQR